jgi:hypothetical protein
MLNFWKAVLGIALLTFGIILLKYEIKYFNKNGRDVYGGYVKVFGSAIGMIIVGLFLLISELMKLN